MQKLKKMYLVEAEAWTSKVSNFLTSIFDTTRSAMTHAPLPPKKWRKKTISSHLNNLVPSPNTFVSLFISPSVPVPDQPMEPLIVNFLLFDLLLRRKSVIQSFPYLKSLLLFSIFIFSMWLLNGFKLSKTPSP